MSIACGLLVLSAVGAHAEDNKPREVHEAFAALMGTALDKTFKADELSGTVPVALAELIKVRYPGTNQLLDQYAACGVAFQARWKEVSDRLGVVREAVTKAQELKAAGKLVEALAAVDAVVNHAAPPPVDHLGRPQKEKRELLEVRDAELEAVTLAAALVVEQKLLERLPQLRADFLARRRVSTSEMTERLAHLAKNCGDNPHKSQVQFESLGRGQKGEALEAVQTVLGYCNQMENAGSSLANGLVRDLGGLGVNVVEVSATTDAKKGSSVLISFEPSTASATRISYKKKDTWKESFNCVWTDQVIGIDPVTGAFQFKRKCDTRTKEKLLTLNAALVKGKPIKKNAYGKYDKVWVFGELKSAGPAWSIKNARVVDVPPASLDFLEDR